MSLTYYSYVALRNGSGVSRATVYIALICWLLVGWTLYFSSMNKLHIFWLAPSALILANYATISRALRSTAGQAQILPPAPMLLTVVYLGFLWWLTPFDEQVYKFTGLSVAVTRLTEQAEGSMIFTGVVVTLILVAGILALLWFMGTPKAMQWVHRQTVRTVLRAIEAKLEATPQESRTTIYQSVAQWRNDRFSGHQKEHYMQLLADAGGFNSDTSMSPEEFAETLAHIEDHIKLKRSGALNS